MKYYKKKILRFLFIFTALVPLTCFANFILFPQETRSILIGFSDFKKDGSLYFDAATSKKDVDKIESLIAEATERVSHFWGGKKSSPIFIYCNMAGDLKKYSVNPGAPAVTYCKLGEHIVLSKDGVNLDIIAHEISHAELYARMGFYIWTFKLPDWFKHGLAMQNDYRDYYSIDTLKARTNNFKTMPDITLFKTGAQFYSGSVGEIMVRYMAAKYFISRWYTKEKLDRLVVDLNSGKSFEESFKQ